MPEDLPTAESIKKLEARRLKQIGNKEKSDGNEG
jgi:hypothetical protein